MAILICIPLIYLESILMYMTAVPTLSCELGTLTPTWWCLGTCILSAPREREPSCTVGAATTENNLEIPQKVKN